MVAQAVPAGLSLKLFFPWLGRCRQLEELTGGGETLHDADIALAFN